MCQKTIEMCNDPIARMIVLSYSSCFQQVMLDLLLIGLMLTISSVDVCIVLQLLAREYSATFCQFVFCSSTLIIMMITLFLHHSDLKQHHD